MKKIKTVIISLLLVIICITATNAQKTKTTMELLIQNDWKTEFKLNENDKITSIWMFTKTECPEKVIFQEQEIQNTFKYYLSNELDTVFNYEKVGKVLNGCYIIMINKFSDITIYEIVKVSDTELDIYALSQKSNQREGHEKVKYIAIPKK